MANTNIIQIINQGGYFDLQFRRDVKHDRLNSPTYYRWKAQFVVTENIQNLNILEKIKKILKCGKINAIKDQARYSVQNIEEIKNAIIPYFKEHTLNEKKKKDFELWSKAVDVIYINKGRNLSIWKKEDFQKLIEIQKSIKKYKEKPKQSKWFSMAETLAEKL